MSSHTIEEHKVELDRNDNLGLINKNVCTVLMLQILLAGLELENDFPQSW